MGFYVFFGVHDAAATCGWCLAFSFHSILWWQ